jgi:hypothetical protein
MEAWRGMGDPRAASPMLVKISAGQEPSQLVTSMTSLDGPQNEPGGHNCRTRLCIW